MQEKLTDFIGKVIVHLGCWLSDVGCDITNYGLELGITEEDDEAGNDYL